jgi:hypothetical protein
MDTSLAERFSSLIRNAALPREQENWLSAFHNLARNSGVLIDPARLVRAVVKYRPLSKCKPNTIAANIKRSSALLNISQNEFVAAALKQPPLFCLKPETIDSNVERSAALLGLARAKFISTAIKQPPLFYLDPLAIANNVARSAALLDIDSQELIIAASRQPQLLYQKPETLNANIERSATLLEIAKQDYAAAALKQPQLFCQKPRTINANVEQSAAKLGIGKESFAAIALKQPSLFYQKPETLSSKKPYILKIANALGADQILAELLQNAPQALLCGKAHLTACRLIAKYGLKQGNKYGPRHSVFSTLFTLSAAKRTALLTDYLSKKIVDPVRRNRILQCLHANGVIESRV